MSKRSTFTSITPLPQGATREVVIDFLHNHLEMIDLNPLVKERHPIKAPPHASPEEFHCIWYSLTDKISYLPGGLASGDVTYTCAFHDLPNGLQTHCYAPMGLDIRDKWTICGSLPGEPVEPVELGIGAPITGLYLREDVDMRCNMLMTGFVKKNLKKSHGVLVDRLKVKAQIASAANLNHSMSIRHSVNSAAGVGGSPDPNLGRPASTATTLSAYGAPASPPVGGSVTWQTLKASNSVSSHYNPRQASWGPGSPPPCQQQQQPFPQSPPMSQSPPLPHSPPIDQALSMQQQMQSGPPGQPGTQYPGQNQWPGQPNGFPAPIQPNQQQQQPDQAGPVELGDYHPQPGEENKKGMENGSGNSGQQKHQPPPVPTVFVAELE